MAVQTWLVAQTAAVLVGRDPIVADTHGAIRRALVGRGGLLLLTGEAGIGKTALAAEAAAYARSVEILLDPPRTPDGSLPSAAELRAQVVNRVARPANARQVRALAAGLSGARRCGPARPRS